MNPTMIKAVTHRHVVYETPKNYQGGSALEALRARVSPPFPPFLLHHLLPPSVKR